MTPADYDLPTAPDYLPFTDWQKIRWPLWSRNERRAAIGQASLRANELMVAETERQKRAKAEAKLKSELPPEPDLEECRTLAQTNPDALSQVQQRTLTAYRQTRALPAAPYHRIDHLWANFRAELANKTPSEMMFISLTYERTFLALAARRDEFTALSFRDEQVRQSAVELAASEQQRMSGQAFDPAKFLASLAGKGIALTVLSGDVHLRSSGNTASLTGSDLAVIEAHRDQLISAIKLTRDI